MRRGIYDNMKTAFDKVNGSSYLFNLGFCSVASRWEKGIVEKNGQDSRHRIWLDAQDCMFHAFEELNVWLGQRCRGSGTSCCTHSGGGSLCGINSLFQSNCRWAAHAPVLDVGVARSPYSTVLDNAKKSFLAVSDSVASQ